MTDKRIPAALFGGAGALAVAVVRVQGANIGVHFRVLFVMGAMLLVGTWIEERLGIGDETGGHFPFHRIVLGQIGLLAYFYFRSLVSHGLGVPGIARIEVFVLLSLVLILVARNNDSIVSAPRRRLFGFGLVWLAWWISFLVFLGARSGSLATPCSDTDVHAYFAKLTSSAGQVLYAHPTEGSAIIYPSLFSALNAIWMDIGGLSPVTITNGQVAIQACLCVGLILEAMIALRRDVPLGGALLMLAATHFIFTLPVNSAAPFLEGTPRQACRAFTIVPLTLAMRLSVSGLAKQRQLVLAIAFIPIAAALCLGMNPASLIAQVPIILAALVWLAATRRQQGPPEGVASRRFKLLFGTVSVAVSLLFACSDAWVRDHLPTLRAPPPAPAEVETPTDGPQFGWSVLAQGARFAAASSDFGIFPPGCKTGEYCPGYLERVKHIGPDALFIVTLVYLLGRRRFRFDAARSAVLAILAIWAGSWIARFMVGSARAIVPHPVRPIMKMARGYCVGELHAAAVLLFILLLAIGCVCALAWLERVRVRAPDLTLTLATIVGAGLLCAWVPGLLRDVRRNYATNTLDRGTAIGVVTEEDVAFAKEIARTVPHGERVLLPGVVEVQPQELWNFAIASARALPLYTDAAFAFFNYQGSPGFGAIEYQRRVCWSLDVPWMVRAGVRWIFTSKTTLKNSCLFGWDELREVYFEEKIRSGDRVLYRIRDERVEDAQRDWRLNLPIETHNVPVVSARGLGITGSVDECGPDWIAGWACDYGAGVPTVVELELTDRRGQKRFRQLHLASHKRESAVARACGDSSSHHGFLFSLIGAPPGKFLARVIGHDAAGQPTGELASDCLLEVF